MSVGCTYPECDALRQGVINTNEYYFRISRRTEASSGLRIGSLLFWTTDFTQRSQSGAQSARRRILGPSAVWLACLDRMIIKIPASKHDRFGPNQNSSPRALRHALRSLREVGSLLRRLSHPLTRR